MSAEFVTIKGVVYLHIIHNNSLICDADISASFGRFAKNITTNILLGPNNTIVLHLWTFKTPTCRRDISHKVTVAKVILNDRWCKNPGTI